MTALPNQARARHDSPDTSHQAAASVNLSDSQQALLAMFRLLNKPILDEGMVMTYNYHRHSFGWPRQSDSGLRSRRAELARAGHLIEGEKMRMSTGRMGRSWKLA